MAETRGKCMDSTRLGDLVQAQHIVELLPEPSSKSLDEIESATGRLTRLVQWSCSPLHCGDISIARQDPTARVPKSDMRQSIY